MSRKISHKAQKQVKKLNVLSKISKIVGCGISIVGILAAIILFANLSVLPAILTIFASLVVAFGGIAGSVALEEKAQSVAEHDLLRDNYQVQSLEQDQTKTVEKEQPKDVVETVQTNEQKVVENIEPTKINEQEDTKNL